MKPEDLMNMLGNWKIGAIHKENNKFVQFIETPYKKYRIEYDTTEKLIDISYFVEVASPYKYIKEIPFETESEFPFEAFAVAYKEIANMYFKQIIAIQESVQSTEPPSRLKEAE